MGQRSSLPIKYPKIFIKRVDIVKFYQENYVSQARKRKKISRLKEFLNIRQIFLTRREERTKRCRLEAKLRTSEAIVAVRTLKFNYNEMKLSNKNKNSKMKLF